MFAGTNPAALTNSQGQGCFGKAHLPFTSMTVQHLVFLSVSISSLTSQSKEHFVRHGHQAACRTVLSSARSRKSLFPVLHCLSKPVNVKPRRRYNLPYTNRGPTSTNAAHRTTFFILTSAPSSQPRSLKPNSLLAPRVSHL